jgi:hypothetical protein
MRFFNINTASLSYRRTLELAGARCELRTDCGQLVSTLERWLVAEAANSQCRFRMQVLVTGDADGFGEAAHFRGMHHVVVASFGRANIFVFDLLRRNIAATVSEGVARDPQFWDELLLPIAVGVLGATVGIVPVHCACLSTGDEGLLVAGASGAGKSTMSAALTQCGLDYVSDDWTYFCEESRGLVAHGMAARMKLLPDAILLFSILERHSLRRSLNGELAYEVPATAFGAHLRRFCEPRGGIFLERMSERSGSEFIQIPKWQARHYLESSVERLPSQLADTARNRTKIMDRIAALPWWKFRYGGTPQVAARELQSFVARQKQKVAV